MDNERIDALVRRHLHDFRNHLNGVAMDVLLIEELASDPQMTESAVRIQSELARMEMALRFVSIRFAAPTPAILPAADLFTMWRTRCKSLMPTQEVEWSCTADSEALCVDANIMANALAEVVSRSTIGTQQATVRVDDSSVRFEVRQSQPSSDDPGLPDFETVIARNGGTYERAYDSETKVSIVACCFALCADDLAQA